MPFGGPVVESFLDTVNIRVDYANATTNYYGYASPGSATSAAVWAIKRETLDTSGRMIAIEWADGNANRDNVWNDRASLSYS